MTVPASISRMITLVEERTGLDAGALFHSELPAMLEELSQGDIHGFTTRLMHSPINSDEWQHLINTITIGETYFLRDTPVFNFLSHKILPQIIAQRRESNRLTLNIWSVGCATGEEPYSIAITLHQMIPDLTNWTINLIGTDINQHALKIAQRAIYRRWAFRHTTDSFKQRYFHTTDQGEQLNLTIRQMVRFRQADLRQGPPLPQLDLIFCRNVMLYFSRQAALQTEDMLYDALKPGAWLFLGPAEALRHQRDRWITHILNGSALYQKPEEVNNAIQGGAIQYQQQTTLPDPPPVPLKILPQDGVITYQDAVNAVQAEQYELAERCLADVLENHPNNAHAHALLAFIFANRQALPEASAHLDLALQHDPLLADAHYVKAMLCMENADMEAGQKALQAALYCKRDHALAAFMLGNLHAQQGNLPRAYKIWRTARRAVENLDEDTFISDLSDISAGRFRALIDQHLDN